MNRNTLFAIVAALFTFSGFVLFSQEYVRWPGSAEKPIPKSESKEVSHTNIKEKTCPTVECPTAECPLVSCPSVTCPKDIKQEERDRKFREIYEPFYLKDRRRYGILHEYTPSFSFIWFTTLEMNKFLHEIANINSMGASNFEDGVIRYWVANLPNHCSRDSIVLDIGSNSGYYSLLAKSLGCPTVIAVDLQEACLKMINGSLLLNGWQMDVIHAAVATGDGLLKVIYDGDSLNCGGRTHIATPSKEPAKEVLVEKRSLTSLVGKNTAELVKIDTEGAEMIILKSGLEAFKNKKIKKVTFELTAFLWERVGVTIEEGRKIFREIFSYGYEVDVHRFARGAAKGLYSESTKWDPEKFFVFVDRLKEKKMQLDLLLIRSDLRSFEY